MLSISAGGFEHSVTTNLTPVWDWDSESCLHIQVFALSFLLGSELALDIVCAKSLQSCLTLCCPIDCRRPPGSLSMGVLQARMLEWAAMPSSRGSFRPRD